VDQAVLHGIHLELVEKSQRGFSFFSLDFEVEEEVLAMMSLQQERQVASDKGKREGTSGESIENSRDSTIRPEFARDALSGFVPRLGVEFNDLHLSSS